MMDSPSVSDDCRITYTGALTALAWKAIVIYHNRDSSDDDVDPPCIAESGPAVCKIGL